MKPPAWFNPIYYAHFFNFDIDSEPTSQKNRILYMGNLSEKCHQAMPKGMSFVIKTALNSD